MEYTEIQQMLNRVHDIMAEDEAQGIFSEVAEFLFTKCMIKKGDEIFRFLEIEFYYNNPNHVDTFVYKGRQCHVPGAFLIHDSGVDICFANQNNDTAYGGILLRHLLRTDKDGTRSVVTGPWNCCDALFNYTDGKTFPRLCLADQPYTHVDLHTTIRCNAGGNRPDAPYCYYDKQFVRTDVNKWGEANIKFPRFNPTTLGTAVNTYTARPWLRQTIKV